LRADIPAAIFVVRHLPASSREDIAGLFSQASSLPAKFAVDGEAIEKGRVYIAPPDRHVMIRHGSISIINGPRENRARPAIDPTLRTAAKVYGPRVTAVILSGLLNDGAYGAMLVKHHGGKVIVQDPDEAESPAMPQSAMA